MRRRSVLRTLAVSGTIAMGAGVGPSPTDVVQSAQAQSNTRWNQEVKLTPDDNFGYNEFGYSAAMSDDGNTAILGAFLEGSGYIFTQEGGSWSQEAELTRNSKDNIGWFEADSVALSGDSTTAIIGGQELKGETDPEVVDWYSYVFTYTGVSWNRQLKLEPDDDEVSKGFGHSAALSSDGKTALVGTYHSETGRQPDETSGPAYVFSESGGTWNEKAMLTPDGEQTKSYSFSIGLSGDGDTAIVGDIPFSAYVFSKENNLWSQKAELTGENPDVNERFGYSVAISENGTIVVIGAPWAGGNGAAYVFNKSNSSWIQEAKLTVDGDDDVPTDDIGSSVAISNDGNTVVIGAINGENKNGDNTGAAHVFNKIDASWRHEEKISADDGESGDEFGHSTAISGDGTTTVITSRGDDNMGVKDAGAGYIFNTTNTPPTNSDSVNVDNPLLDPSNVEGNQSTHTLSFVAKNVSADGTGNKFNDVFEITFPEEVVLESYSNEDIDAQFSAIEQSGNTLTFSVSPSGGGTTQVSVEMDVTLSPARNQ